MLFNKERSLQVMEEAGIDALVAGTPANVIYMTAYMPESILDRFYECMSVGIMPCRADALPTLVTEDETDEMIELVSMMPSDPNVGKTAHRSRRLGRLHKGRLPAGRADVRIWRVRYAVPDPATKLDQQHSDLRQARLPLHRRDRRQVVGGRRADGTATCGQGIPRGMP